jgi:hypothetical protein
MKKTYSIERGSHGIIIKRINDATMRIATNIMSYKILRECCKDEVPSRVVADAV